MGKVIANALEAAIEEKIGKVRTEAIDLSFGEIISLSRSQEFIISPDFQRFFRWSESQQSRLIESILLELPIPQIFVIENGDGVLELIDGLQRISSVMHFIDSSLLEERHRKPLVLSKCDLIPELNGKRFEDLPLSLRLRIKRSSLRTVIIKRQSTPSLRYSMFQRLNTGGTNLSSQEIRNCTSHMAGETGERFYAFLQKCATQSDFVTCTAMLPQADRDQRQDEELVLRFFALKNGQDLFDGSVPDWLDEYMERVIFGESEFDYPSEEHHFERVFGLLNRTLGSEAFSEFRDNSPVGGLVPAHFEAVTIGTYRSLSVAESLESEKVRDAIVQAVQTKEFRDQVGSGANTQTKQERRVAIIAEAINGLL